MLREKCHKWHKMYGFPFLDCFLDRRRVCGWIMLIDVVLAGWLLVLCSWFYGLEVWGKQESWLGKLSLQGEGQRAILVALDWAAVCLCLLGSVARFGATQRLPHCAHSSQMDQLFDGFTFLHTSCPISRLSHRLLGRAWMLRMRIPRWGETFDSLPWSCWHCEAFSLLFWRSRMPC